MWSLIWHSHYKGKTQATVLPPTSSMEVSVPCQFLSVSAGLLLLLSTMANMHVRSALNESLLPNNKRGHINLILPHSRPNPLQNRHDFTLGWQWRCLHLRKTKKESSTFSWSEIRLHHRRPGLGSSLILNLTEAVLETPQHITGVNGARLDARTLFVTMGQGKIWPIKYRKSYSWRLCLRRN